jgi:protocatechuate 3,4-dioxygenase beta subunit
MSRVRLSRRDLLERCAVFGALVTLPVCDVASVSAFWEQAEVRKPTPPNALGPFYKKRAPDTRMLRTKGDAGMPLALSGRVIDTRGEAVADATVEIWHADHGGHYDLAGYRFRAKVPVDGKAGYQIETIMPGHYPDRVCQHVHYLVTAPGHKPLITQLYFATDPVFEGDADKNFSKDPLIQSRELVRPVTIAGDPKAMYAAVAFELCLERR